MPVKSKISPLVIAGCILAFGVGPIGPAEAKVRHKQCSHSNLSNAQTCSKLVTKNKAKAPVKGGIGADTALTILELIF